ncbi:MAG: DUF5717 family protein, partial [Butyrivibrio sp.]|nr:DUF5717 family protein [Butyrivibrio sp.]
VNKGSGKSVEEFLLSINKKQKVEFVPEKEEIFIEMPSHSSDNILILSRVGWGYTHLEVVTDGDFLTSTSSVLTGTDFQGDICHFHYQIDNEMLHSGNNYGALIFSNEYTRLVVKVTVNNSYLDEKPYTDYREKKDLLVQLIKQYEHFREKKNGSRVWLAETGKIISKMSVVDPDDIVFRLYSAQYYITATRVNEGQRILDDVAEELNKGNNVSDSIYAYYLYLTTLVSRENAYINEAAIKIENIYKKDPSNWRVAWLLQYVSEEYLSSDSLRWEMFSKLFDYGCRSSIIYLEALNILSGAPSLLNKLGNYELFILEFGARENILSPAVIDQIVYLSHREKVYSDKLYKILAKCHEIKRSDETTEAICVLLIKGNRTDKEAFEWYASGIDRELRITRLYEYYMMSIYRDDSGKLPREISKMVLMYFSYQSDLDYEHNTILYRYIHENREQYPELYETYRPRIEKFLMDQLDKGRLSRDLIYLYKNIVSKQMIDAGNASNMLAVLYAYEIKVEDDRIHKMLVIYEKCAVEIEYPVRDGVLYAPLYGSDYAILFEDAAGNRFYSSVKYTLTRLINGGDLADYVIPYIQKGQENVDLFLCELGKDAYNITLENVTRYRELLESDIVRDRNKNEIMLSLIRFYYDNDFTRQLTEYLEFIEFDKVSSKERNQLIELMVNNGMYDKVIGWVRRYGICGIDPKIMVRLCDRLLDRNKFGNHENDTRVAFGVFAKGKYDEQLLKFLVENYDGSVREMRDIWKVARTYGIDVYTLSEKMLVQMLYSGAYVGEKTSILREYIKGGSKTKIEKAYLAQCAYDSFVRDVITDGYIFDRIGKLYLEGEDLPDVCKLAYLRYFSEQKADMGQNMEISRRFLDDMDAKGVYFQFFQKYITDSSNMNRLSDQTIFEYRTKPGMKVVIHYMISTEREALDTNYKKIVMKEMYDGIFVASFVLFFGEELQYYITEGDIADDETGEKSRLTESGTISKNDIVQNTYSDRFTIINDIMIGEALQDYDTVDNLMKEFHKKRFMSKKLFLAVK